MLPATLKDCTRWHTCLQSIEIMLMIRSITSPLLDQILLLLNNLPRKSNPILQRFYFQERAQMLLTKRRGVALEDFDRMTTSMEIPESLLPNGKVLEAIWETRMMSSPSQKRTICQENYRFPPLPCPALNPNSPPRNKTRKLREEPKPCLEVPIQQRRRSIECVKEWMKRNENTEVTHVTSRRPAWDNATINRSNI